MIIDDPRINPRTRRPWDPWDYVSLDLTGDVADTMAAFVAWAWAYESGTGGFRQRDAHHALESQRWGYTEGRVRTLRGMSRGPVMAVQNGREEWRHPGADRLTSMLWGWSEGLGTLARQQGDARRPSAPTDIFPMGGPDEHWRWVVGDHWVDATMTGGISVTIRGRHGCAEPDDADRLAGALAGAAEYVRNRREHRDGLDVS